MMSVLFRNPLMRLLGRVWWFPILAFLILAFGFRGDDGLGIMALLILIIPAIIAGLFLLPLINGFWKGWQLKDVRRTLEYRFLCPDCLNFGPFEYACEACGNPVEPFLVHTDGAFVTTCAHCNLALYTEEDPDGRSVRARCDKCHAHSDRDIYHNRAVRTIATLTSNDFIALTEQAAIEIRKSQDNIRYAVRDDGAMLTVILNLGDLDQAITPDSITHALRDIYYIWIDCASLDPLALGQMVDAIIMRAELPEERWRAIAACARQPEIDPASRHVLETRFGAFRSGVSMDDFLMGRRPGLGATSDRFLTAVQP